MTKTKLPQCSANPCIYSKKAVKGSNHLCCKNCCKFYHRICLNITLKDFKNLSKSEWYCFDCTGPGNNLLEALPPPEVHEIFDPFEVSFDLTEYLNKVILKNQLPLFMRGLSVGHLNINGITSKFEDIKSFLDKTNFHIFALTETKLEVLESSDPFQIHKYNFIRSDRIRGKEHGGGIGIYLRNDINYLPLTHEVTFPQSTEVYCIQCWPKHNKPFILVTIYNPPDACKTEFSYALNELFMVLIKHKLQVIVTGDLNIDLLENTKQTQILRNMCRALNLTQLIDTPTRIATTRSKKTNSSKTTSTLIDHIYVSKSYNVCQSGTFTITTSDHLCIFTIFNSRKIKYQSKVILYRKLSKIDFKALNEKLINYDWSKMLLLKSNDLRLDFLEKFLLAELDRLAPARKVRIKGRPTPWFNSVIIEAIKMRDILLADFRKSKSQSDKKKFNVQRNVVNKLVSKSKREYFRNKLLNIIESKTLWTVIKELEHKNSEKQHIAALKVNNKIITDDKEISDALAESFIVPPENTKLNRQLFEMSLSALEGKPGTDQAEQTLTNFCPVTCDEILTCTKTFKIKNLAGNPLPPLFLKNTFAACLVPLSILFTCIFQDGNVPQGFKKATVLPLFKKKGSRSDPANYRLLSNLSSYSKVFERIIKARILNKVEDSKLLSDQQHGFRSHRSCQTALTVFSQYVFDNLEKKKKVLVTYVDFKKAFDFVGHRALLYALRDIFKLEPYLLRTLSSYFFDRLFRINLGDFLSKGYTVNRGVPQGSVLGPILFLLFFNSVSNEIKTEHLMFADDIAFYNSGDNVDELINDMSLTLKHFDDWCHKYGLQINYTKTEYMIFDYKKDYNVYKPVVINNTVINKVHQFKYLGVIFDTKLKFNLQIKAIESKVNSAVGGILKLKRNINTKVLSLLIHSYILSITDYCLPIWGWSVQSQLDEIQKKIYRVLIAYYHPSLDKFRSKRQWAKLAKLPKGDQNDYKKTCHRLYKKIDNNDLLERCGILTINERLCLASATAVFKSVNFDNNIVALKDFYKLSDDRQYDIKTRSCTSKGLIQPRVDFIRAKKSIKYSSVTYWNSLPSFIRAAKSLFTFKKRLTEHIIKAREEDFIRY